ncbi:spermidine synthase [Paenibacillus sp. UNCCL117]|uniref:spermidine synthase n=1 Tax=unclassified Paenibacillus TaxID=185978 RepID=UPI000890F086|nr:MULTISPECIES: fused MFS/spermidine synthase [unclassified Paenibacillus]SDC01087.1 spermidine synthase [Paenibacillus sp. cl123]SFW36509.1 spermidine synthase [Paenibacillus sp. UNCCL117]
MHIRYRTSSGDQEITVCDVPELYGEKGSFRVLQFSNEAIQGAMDLNRPERMVFEYPRAILHLMEINDPAFEDVFMIGHGTGMLAGRLTDKRCKVAEIDGEVVAISRAWFGYSGDNVTVGDGRQLLAEEKPHTFDYIVLDAFTEKGTPRHLTSREFFSLAREQLDPEGAIIMNLTGKGEHDPLICAIHATLDGVYAYTGAFVLPSEGAGDIRNMLLMGSAKPIRHQARSMAGFREIELQPGHVLWDISPAQGSSSGTSCDILE